MVIDGMSAMCYHQALLAESPEHVLLISAEVL